jgi:DNA-binding HxlR family transcriptional regulator
MRPPGSRRKVAVATLERPEQPTSCCPHFHRAVELVGKRWTGAILYVLLESGRPLRFSEIGHAVPALSDRLLSERMKELEAAGIVERHVTTTSPVRVEYELTEQGRELDPALGELKRWADRWLD